MKFNLLNIVLLVGTFVLTGCGGTDAREGEIDPNETVETSPDYEDSDRDGDGEISYVEQSARGPSTTNTTNYSARADSIMNRQDSVMIDPKYTDDEYESAYSTSTTKPKNQ